MEAGPSTATSLAELASIRPGFEGLGQSWVQLLSHQTSLGHPSPLAALMLQRTLPHTLLTASEVRFLVLVLSMGVGWGGERGGDLEIKKKKGIARKAFVPLPSHTHQ